MTNEECAIHIQQGRTALYTELWEQTKRLLFKLAYRFYNRHKEQFAASGIEIEDIEQMCFFALCDAVQAYDNQKDFRLSSYFKYSIRNRLLKMISQNGQCDPLNISTSLDVPISEECDFTLLDTIIDDNAELAYKDCEERVFCTQLHNKIATAMQNSLTHEEQKILEAVFYHGHSLSAVCKEQKTTMHKVRKSYYQSLQKLKIKNPELKDFSENYISEHAYRYTSFNSFHERQASSQEIILERIMIKMGV